MRQATAMSVVVATLNPFVANRSAAVSRMSCCLSPKSIARVLATVHTSEGCYRRDLGLHRRAEFCQQRRLLRARCRNVGVLYVSEPTYAEWNFSNSNRERVRSGGHF